MKRRDEYRIGDPIEVAKVELTDGPPGWEECAKTHTTWIPATVCATRPLCVAYANGTREAINNSTAVREPEGGE